MCRLLRLGRGTTAHESCTPKLDGKFSGLSYESRVPWPPTTSIPLHCHPLHFQAAPQFPFRPFPVTKTIHIALVYYPSRLCAYTFDISRKREHGCSQSIGFEAPKPCPAVTGESSRGWFQEIEKSWGVSSVIAAPREPFVPCFRQRSSLIKRCHGRSLLSANQLHWLAAIRPICQFRSFDRKHRYRSPTGFPPLCSGKTCK